MTEAITITVADIEAVAAKLENLEILDAHEQAALTDVFLLAGQAVSYRADDVTGFSLNFTKGAADSPLARAGLLPAVKPGGAGPINGFSGGLHGGGGGGAGMSTDQFPTDQ